jgi:hypothetical protein
LAEYLNPLFSMSIISLSQVAVVVVTRLMAVVAAAVVLVDFAQP